MPKTCQYKECNNPVFSKGYCIYHQRKTGYSLNRTKSIRKVSKNQSVILGERAKLTQKDRLLFAEIWNERPHIDFETGEPIYGEPLTLYFHHVLGKRKTAYPQFRYEKWNIILVSWETHTKAENKLDLVPKIKEYTLKLKKQYEK
jgi:hypothetical protein